VFVYYYNYNHFTVPWTVSGTTQVSLYQKDKTSLVVYGALIRIAATILVVSQASLVKRDYFGGSYKKMV